MVMTREKMYFEPRVVSDTGTIRWYGDRYMDRALLGHMGETVYIRDDVETLLVYRLESDQLQETEKIEATFVSVCRIRKTSHRYKYQYGRKIS